MIKIKIITPENIGIIESGHGHSLLDILRKSGIKSMLHAGVKEHVGNAW